MKLDKFIVFVLTICIAIPCLVLADGFVIEVANKAGTTQTVTGPASAVKGWIEDIRVDVTGTTTGTVTITRANGEVIFSNSTPISADATYRPRAADCDLSGVALAGTSSSVSRVFLNSEKLTVSVAETAAVTNTYKVIFTTSRDNR